MGTYGYSVCATSQRLKSLLDCSTTTFASTMTIRQDAAREPTALRYRNTALDGWKMATGTGSEPRRSDTRSITIPFEQSVSLRNVKEPATSWT